MTDRTAFIPQTRTLQGADTASKFGGVAFIPKGQQWPTCRNCRQPMQLLVQLDNASAPVPWQGAWEGLLQVFYCTNSEAECESSCHAWDASNFDKESVLVRALKPGEGEKIAHSPVADAFPERLIESWEAKEDHPDSEEEAYDGDEDGEGARPIEGDKLGGWPLWIQGPEYPDCPQCAESMRVVLQIDSECNIPYMFGDMGVAHVTQCSSHRNVFGFGWACS